MGIKYEYENQGYDLDGVRYLPDFWLPRLDLWVEIKGERLKPGSDDEEKVKRLVKQSRKSVAVFWGQIHTTVNSPDLYIIAESLPDWDTMKVCEALVIDRSSSWTECPVCHIVGLARYASPSLLPCGCCKDADKSPSIIAAYADARKARFEHEDAKPKQKVKPSFNPAPPKVVETKKSASLSWPDWDDMPLLDEANKTSDSRQVSKEISPLPELPDWDDVPLSLSKLILEEVKDHWDSIKRRIRSKKDGVKIEVFLKGYEIIGVENMKDIPVVIIQANAVFFYNALYKNASYLEAIELAIELELKQKCQIKLMEPIKLKGPQEWKRSQFKVNDLVRHSIFGEGVVLKSEMEGNTEFVDVRFGSDHGDKRLSVDFAKLENLGNPF